MVKAKEAAPDKPVDKIGRRNTIILFICFIAVVLTTLWLIFRPFILSNFDRRYRTIDYIPTPTQINKTGAERIERGDVAATIRYRAIYDIRGIVISTASYAKDAVIDRISPYDIGLAWGEMAKHNNLIKWHQGHRYVTASINALAKFFINKSQEELFQQYSNNHLIFKDDELLEKAQSFQVGDYIRIKGYLVDVDAYRKTEPAIKHSLKTSLTRKDDGEDSCEVLLVTKIESLD
jgi:hypothetical protein